MLTVKITKLVSELPFKKIYQYLSEESYWSMGIPEHTVKNAMQNSLNAVAYYNESFSGYARIVSDYSTMAYLCDVFVLPEFRHLKVASTMLKEVHSYECLQGLRRWILITKDAHQLYEKLGWTPLEKPLAWMNIHNPTIYSNQNPTH